MLNTIIKTIWDASKTNMFWNARGINNKEAFPR